MAEFRKHGHEVVFKDDEYEFDNLEEVKRVRGSQPARLVVASKTPLGPAMRFARWSKTGLILRQGANPNDRILLLSIGEVLNRRRSWFTRLLNSSVLGTLAFLAFAGVFIAPEAITGYLFFGSFALLFAAGVASEVHTGLGSSLNLAHRHATSTFLSRHGQKIFYLAIGAIVTTAVTFVAEKFLND